MKYLVVSAAVTDEIHFTDGTVKIVPGGAGIYALCGIKLWDDDVTILTGVGEDYQEMHGHWYKNNNISMAGLKVKDAKSPYTIIKYFEDGEREEVPRYGEDHFYRLETTPDELKEYMEYAQGIYIFKNADKKFWDQILSYKKDYSSKILWEISADAANKDNLSMIQNIASQIDAFSINFTESKCLFGSDDKDYIIKELQGLKTKLVFLRMGAQGAIMISEGEIVCVPSQKNVNVVDPTGGGNSSSGGVLCGIVNGYSARTCGVMGSISAQMCISQYGVPEIIDERIRKAAFCKAEIGD